MKPQPQRRFYGDSAGLRVTRSADSGPVELAGLASVYYREDDPGTEFELYRGKSYRIVERIMPGAFDRALREKDDVVALMNHDKNLVLGRTGSGTLKLSENKNGLAYAITLPDTQTARDLAESVGRGDIRGSSFAFLPDDVTYRETPDADIVEVRSVRLFDVGPVTFPAYASTSTGLRADDAEAALAQYRERFPALKKSLPFVYSARLRLIELDQR